MSIIARVFTILGCAVLGAVVGAVGTVAHASLEPLGVILAVIASTALVLALRLLIDRWASVAASVGLIGAIVLFSGPGPGGSIIAPAEDPYALVWAIAAPLLAAVIVAFPTLPVAPVAPASASAPRTQPPA
ncbi:DUF6113 family protein [uncultured Microbacterium sp.]|uniref:DUF6113 family protein n=1 Tax=uncultured Microbacterium sp. TaxID=191216 RepID=UPI0026225B7C|nr:DUF6113 family protein [uncultured Microbacterium sp.]